MNALNNDQKKMIEEHYILYHKKLYNIAIAIVKDSFVAEDILQDVFIYICNRIQNKNLDSLKEDFEGLLVICTKHRAYNYMIKKQADIHTIYQEQLESIPDLCKNRDQFVLLIDDLLYDSYKITEDILVSHKILKKVLKQFKKRKLNCSNSDKFILLKKQIANESQKYKESYA